MLPHFNELLSATYFIGLSFDVAPHSHRVNALTPSSSLATANLHIELYPF